MLVLKYFIEYQHHFLLPIPLQFLMLRKNKSTFNFAIKKTTQFQKFHFYQMKQKHLFKNYTKHCLLCNRKCALYAIFFSFWLSCVSASLKKYIARKKNSFPLKMILFFSFAFLFINSFRDNIVLSFPYFFTKNSQVILVN